MGTRRKPEHLARFNFGSNPDPENLQFGTLSELLNEINLEYKPKSGEAASFDSLERELGLIQQITGETIPSQTVHVPLPALKAIKLLFLAKKGSKRHLIGLIESPSADNPATMEYCSVTTVSRDKDAAKHIQLLIDTLELEIAPDKLAALNEMLGAKENTSTAEKLGGHVEKTNDVISQLFNERMSGDNLGQANGYYKLAKKVDAMQYRTTGQLQTPAHESLYCHLQTLGFRHYILHHRKFIEQTHVNQRINAIEEQIKRVCRTLTDIRGSAVHGNEKIISVNDFPKLAAVYHREFNALVLAATGLSTRKNRFIDNIGIAKVILASYGCRSYDEPHPDAKILSLLDLVAALCAVRYQQQKELKTKYSPFWHGQVSQGDNPERHLKKGLRKNDPHQHQGVFQTYYYRFSEFLAALANRTESHNGWMAYQLSRLDVYDRIIRFNDINCIVASSRHFDHMCLAEAERIVEDYSHCSV